MYRIKNPSIYNEVVFCGYGEPFKRFETLKKVAQWLKKMGSQKVRVDTCGLGFMLAGENCLKELKGTVDTLSISLNAGTKEEYLKTVRPSFGEKSWESALKFIKEAKKEGYNVIITAVKHPNFNEEKFKKLAEELGVNYRIRPFKRFKKWEE